MASQPEWQDILQGIIGSHQPDPKRENVFYQPPASVELVYPCIIYTLDNIHTLRADNINYMITPTYEVKIITRNPNNPYLKKMLMDISTAKFHRRFVNDGLYHDILSVY